MVRFFKWLLIRQEAYQFFVDEAAQLAAENESQRALHSAELISEANRHRNELFVMQKHSASLEADFDDFKTTVKADLEILTSQRDSARSDCAKANAIIQNLTESNKALQAEMVQLRKIIWDVPVGIPPEVAKQIDWARLGLPEPQ